MQYRPEQRERQNLLAFDPEAPEWWVEGSRDEQSVWLPAALVFCPLQRRPWLAYGHPSSNAGACHPVRAHAIAGAWRELVERDAFIRTWYSGDPPDRLNTELLSRPVRELAGKISRAFGVLEVCSLAGPTTLPVSLGVCLGPERLVVGACAHPDPNERAFKALTEVWVQLTHPLRGISDAGSVQTPTDHGALFATSVGARRGRWLLEGDRVASAGRVGRDSLSDVPTRMATYTRQFGGWWVARTLDPELIPISFGFDQEPTGREDLALILNRSGGQTAGTPLRPHPFA